MKDRWATTINKRAVGSFLRACLVGSACGPCSVVLTPELGIPYVLIFGRFSTTLFHFHGLLAGCLGQFKIFGAWLPAKSLLSIALKKAHSGSSCRVPTPHDIVFNPTVRFELASLLNIASAALADAESLSPRRSCISA
jgi:hypothetical protein